MTVNDIFAFQLAKLCTVPIIKSNKHVKIVFQVEIGFVYFLLLNQTNNFVANGNGIHLQRF